MDKSRRASARRTARIAGLCAGLLAAEALLRVLPCGGPWLKYRFVTEWADKPDRLMRTSPHPFIGIELIPHARAVVGGREFRVNAHGLRGPETYRCKPAETFRIVGVGDSVMMGWGVAQGEDYLSVLGELLRAQGRSVETLNFAVAGYNTVQEYYALRDKALAFDPDLVILGYVGNDLEGPNFKEPRRRPSTPSALVNYLLSRGLHLLAGNELYDWRPHGKVPEPHPRDFWEALEGIGALCRSRGIPWVMALDSRYQAPALRHRAAAALGRENGATVLDLRALLRRRPDGATIQEDVTAQDEHNRLYSIPGDTHLNALWHRRVGRALAGLLERRGLVESGSGSAPGARTESPR